MESLLKITENLVSFRDPAPSNSAKNAAAGLAKLGKGDGHVYSPALLKTVRGEFAGASINTCKDWIRLGVYVIFFLLEKVYLIRSLSGKEKTIGVLTKWWETSTSMDPFKMDAIDFGDWKTCPDIPCAWAMEVAMVTFQNKGKGSVTFVFSHFTV